MTWRPFKSGNRSRALFAYGRNQSGAAAVELALWATILALPIFSVFNIGTYVYQRMQVEHAAEMAAQAIWVTCGTVYLPATIHCSGANAAATAAAQSTSLSTNITVSSIAEGYYCLDGSGNLQPTGGALTAGTTVCSNGSTSSDYIQVTTTYTFNRPFGGLGVNSVLGSTVTKTAWMRLK